ncbi:MAG: UDP-N-acetylglucosamine 2-epimerase (non-hydrolyzing), partial [Candidatus Bathyarchaeia archaeon]
AEEIGLKMVELDSLLSKLEPDLCLVLGDTNSTLVGALVSSKRHIPVIHVEAGLRSFDMDMPEEVNRIIVDDISTILFAPSDLAVENLNREGISKNVYMVGNTIVDLCLRLRNEIANLNFYKKMGLERNGYAILTIHREANTRDEALKRIVDAILKLDIPLVFPVHPRAGRRLSRIGLLDKLMEKDSLIISDPLGYREFLSLMVDSKLILTDSGGVQEEAITLGKPCLTLRDNTERWETVHLGANRLIGTDPSRIIEETKRAWMDEEWEVRIKGLKNPYGDGRASERIASKLEEARDMIKSRAGSIRDYLTSSTS